MIWPMPPVSNTSPLLNLAIIGRLSLLHQQFGEIWIPPAVVQELLEWEVKKMTRLSVSA
jgi:predicted nucleic acid-binding protein